MTTSRNLYTSLIYLLNVGTWIAWQPCPCSVPMAVLSLHTHE
jgi:hypothetical protein